jgi:hypothetical protein
VLGRGGKEQAWFSARIKAGPVCRHRGRPLSWVDAQSQPNAHLDLLAGRVHHVQQLDLPARLGRAPLEAGAASPQRREAAAATRDALGLRQHTLPPVCSLPGDGLAAGGAGRARRHNLLGAAIAWQRVEKGKGESGCVREPGLERWTRDGGLPASAVHDRWLCYPRSPSLAYRRGGSSA